MLKVGLVGIGFMGRGHLDNYIRLESEGFPVRLTAICDVDEEKFKGRFVPGNIDVGNARYDFSKYHLYTDLDDMLEQEDLDYVDIALPTYLHGEASIKALNKGLHVLCEKPMALNAAQCEAMAEAARQNGTKLMIAQCMRFWPEYEYLKECVETGRFRECAGRLFLPRRRPPPMVLPELAADQGKERRLSPGSAHPRCGRHPLALRKTGQGVHYRPECGAGQRIRYRIDELPL